LHILQVGEMGERIRGLEKWEKEFMGLRNGRKYLRERENK